MLKLQLIVAGSQRWDENVFTYMPWVRLASFFECLLPLFDIRLVGSL